MNNINARKKYLITFFIFIFTLYSFSQTPFDTEMDKSITKLMRIGKIPGISVVIIDKDETHFKNYGYADLNKKIKITEDTLFELGSCSKSLTAIGLLILEQQGKVNLDDPVSHYFSGFHGVFREQKYEITIRQLLHHCSGIPTDTMAYIPEGDDIDAFDQLIANLNGIELWEKPGKRYQYATVNYGIIGAIIEKVSGQKFEDYMEQNVFAVLALNDTTVGHPEASENLATGYKVAFNLPIKFNAPVYRANYPSGYIVSNITDIERWLKLNMRMIDSELAPLIAKSQIPNRTVPPYQWDLHSYAMGWFVYQIGSGRIAHGGMTPNYTAYIALRPEDKLAVAVLGNANSGYTSMIGHYVFDVMRNEPKKLIVYESGTEGIGDQAFSIISVILFIYILALLVYFVSIFVNLIKKKRLFRKPKPKSLLKLLLAIPLTAFFFYNIYIMPQAMTNYTWEVALAWAPISFHVMVILLVISFMLSLICFSMSFFFPLKDSYINNLPQLVVLSLISGIANSVLIFLITSSFTEASMRLPSLVYYFILAVILYICGRKIVQTRLIRYTYDFISYKRLTLIKKIFETNFQKYEKMDTGRIFATINNDTELIGEVANIAVSLITSAITVICAFLFLGNINLLATILSLVIIALIASLYYLISIKARVYMEKARDTQNIFLKLIDGMINGYKELIIHLQKKKEFRNDIEKSCYNYTEKSSRALINFTNAFIVGETLLVIVLGIISFLFPLIFIDLHSDILLNFVMVLLYLIGPINAILNAIPRLMRIRVASKRVQKLIAELPEVSNSKQLALKPETVNSLEVKDLIFKYEGENDQFHFGSVNFKVHKGEVLFIVGGNGSGKTTLLKLITGLYNPEQGAVLVDGIKIDINQIGEYYSVVFDDFYLFEKLYSIDTESKKDEINKYLKILRLDELVSIKNNKFSTLNLSNGQRKRLALLRCYIEDRPIFLFDEWAADQDPTFRKFFYRELLPAMREKGKIIIAITHDDHYFDAADKVMKLEMGKVEYIKEQEPQFA